MGACSIAVGLFLERYLNLYICLMSELSQQGEPSESHTLSNENPLCPNLCPFLSKPVHLTALISQQWLKMPFGELLRGCLGLSRNLGCCVGLGRDLGKCLGTGRDLGCRIGMAEIWGATWD